MAEVIVIGTRAATQAYETAARTCFEPKRRHLAEKLLAERVRCALLAITRPAYDALPAALATTLSESIWPALEIVPVLRDTEAAHKPDAA